MDKIQEIIRTFSKDDATEFKNFINRLKKKSNRKDLELFDLLNNSATYKSEELIDMLYPDDKNTEAYHATRKRLTRQLSDFIHYKKINEISNNESKALSLYYLSQHLFEEGKDAIACSYIKKAEQIAEKQKLFSILHKIYLLQMQYSDSEYAEPFNVIIRKKKLNLEKLYKTDDIITAQKVIYNRLTEVLNEKGDFHIELLIKSVVADHELGNAVDEDFDFLFSIIKTVEDVVKKSHKFEAFERYLIPTHNEFKETIGSKNLNKHLEFLYMISHTLFMTRKYPLAEKYMLDLENLLPNASQSLQSHYSSLIVLVRAKIKTYTGKPQSACELLHAFIQSNDKLPAASKLNLELAYAFNLFLTKNTSAIHEIFTNQKHSDDWCTKVAGEKWAIRKKTLLALLAFDNGELQNFDTQIRLIQKAHPDFINASENTFWRKLLQLLTKLETAKIATKENELFPEVLKLKKGATKNIDDIAAYIIYSWVGAVIAKKEFYSASLDLHATLD